MRLEIFVVTLVVVLVSAFTDVAGAAPAIFPPRATSLMPGGATMKVSGRRVVDLGSDLSGYVVMDVKKGSTEASYSESLRNLKPGGDMGDLSSLGRDDAPGPEEDSYGPGIHRSRLHGGFRYILLEGHASIDRLDVIPDFLRPPAEDSGTFYSSDLELNRIWQAGVETLDLSTARGPKGWVVIDGAKRDRMIWLGDLEMESLTGPYASSELLQALGRTIRLFSCEQLPDGYIPMVLYTSASCPDDAVMPEGQVSTEDPRGLLGDDALPAYTPALISASRDLFEFGGDRRLAWAMLPTLEHAVDYLDFHLGADGLFHDAGEIDWRAFDRPQDVDTYTNAAWVEALEDLSYLEDSLGLYDLASEHRSKADDLAAAVRADLEDPGSGLLIDGDADPTITQAANVRAALAGIVSDPASLLTRLSALLASPYGPMTTVQDSPYTEQYISPFMSGWQLIALLRAGDGFGARRLMRILWGRMADGDPGTMWEAMGLDGRPFAFDRGGLDQGVTSLAHGWSTAPVYALPAFAAGLRPSSPGWDHWVLAPVSMGLRFAEASVKTPRGRIDASWSRAADSITVDVRSPEHTSGEIVSPCGQVYRVRGGTLRRTLQDDC